MSNHLKNQSSPYLLQHAENPVDWYPWGQEAFCKAKEEDKPIFLSIGYSTCHWCHVMAHESFEDQEIAGILNRHFISIKVDKEERPDIDSIYMAVCQAFTGSGGWPMSIFMTAEQKPFFAGTYFPKTSRYGSIGFKELLLAIHEKWENSREALLASADEITALFHKEQPSSYQTDESLIGNALRLYRKSYDESYGGFGRAPKFPAPHNLLFLLQQYSKHGNQQALAMAEGTLQHMYAGGLFDHIGYGFCRYSTDRFYLIPHFEKMLYDNALLILAYCKAYDITKNSLYKEIAEKTASYLLTEMMSSEGGFYSAQDADSDGEEGKYYAFLPDELTQLLGEKDGAAFNKHYGITPKGNFEGKSVPNLLQTKDLADHPFDNFLPIVRNYRKHRTQLHTDDKVLTSWNSLMIAALCALYRSSCTSKYLAVAKQTQKLIENNLCDADTLYVSFRDGTWGEKGFLDDYASYIFALLSLYEATLDRSFLDRAQHFANKVILQYFDAEHGGFYLYSADHETLLFRPKECYDGAVPSGNSLMAYNLTRLNQLMPDQETKEVLQKQLAYLSGEAAKYPTGYAMFLIALSDHFEPPAMITVVKGSDELGELPVLVPTDALVKVLDRATDEYRVLDGETTFYICQNFSCLPPIKQRQWLEKIKHKNA